MNKNTEFCQGCCYRRTCDHDLEKCCYLVKNECILDINTQTKNIL